MNSTGPPGKPTVPSHVVSEDGAVVVAVDWGTGGGRMPSRVLVGRECGENQRKESWHR